MVFLAPLGVVGGVNHIFQQEFFLKRKLAIVDVFRYDSFLQSSYWQLGLTEIAVHCPNTRLTDEGNVFFPKSER